MKVPLTGGAYTARSLIASAQRSVNLYAEPLPQQEGEPSLMAHYPTPGLITSGTIGNGPIRGIRQCSNGVAYAVSGSSLYTFWPATHVGDITPGLNSPVSMMDNTVDLVIVDGSVNGWKVDLASNTFSQITDPNLMFSGANKVDYIDTYLLFNKPNTPQFYSSDSLAVTFDPLFFANKSAAPDYLISLAVARREIWLIGARTTEIWFDAGSADFPFQIMPNIFIDHGCAAKFSPVVIDNGVFWLARDRNGQGIVVQGANYQATRVSTYAIEAELATYARIDDAIGMTYQLAGHQFYVLTFPTADKTWCYDITTHEWHEWVWIDANGTEHRHRASAIANIDGVLYVGDWQSNQMYVLSNAAGDDAGNPIKRVRGFPHLLADGKRVSYRQFLADMETGTAGNASPLITSPQVSLRWSDDRGHSWGNPVLTDLGASGAYLRSLQWQRLGMARDRVFELSWSSSNPTALQSAWIEATPAQS